MKLVIIGPLGAGKGTQGDLLSNKYGIPHIALGDILREEIKRDTELGRSIQDYLDRGDLVPDGIVNEVIRQRLSEADCMKGFILDGYPRTIAQARALDRLKELDRVIHLDIADEVIIQRLLARRICKRCGSIYNLRLKPPKQEGICDHCGGELYKRKDDEPEVARKRLDEYKKVTRPLIDLYRSRGICRDIIIREEKPIKEIFNIICDSI